MSGNRENLHRIFETLSTSGTNSVVGGSNNEGVVGRYEQLGIARGSFIELIYPEIFGPEEMGDPSASLSPEELTGLLAAYEQHLNGHGLLANEERI